MPTPECLDGGRRLLVRAEPVASDALAKLFDALVAAGDDRWFRPHPMTRQEAERICRYRGLDEYHLAFADGSVVGYGMLRGWDEEYEVPSLGIAVHPAHRQRGFGRAMMAELHEIARARGATRVRLRVHADNLVAIALYRDLGYRFEDTASADDAGLVVGYLELVSPDVVTD